MLLLASASPARRRLLQQAAIPHRVQVSGVDEEALADPDPQRLVEVLAAAKASAVAASLVDGAWFDPALADPSPEPISAVLGCDSVLVFQGEVHGKPRDGAEAVKRWRRLAGHWGELHTGHCLVHPSPGRAGGLQQQRAVVTTRVQFAPLSLAEIEAYVATGEPLQCAGGFALEGRGGLVVERIEGCFSNVIGLSLPLLRRWLRAPGTADP